MTPMICPACEGQGFRPSDPIGDPCPVCGGSGRINEEEKEHGGNSEATPES